MRLSCGGHPVVCPARRPLVVPNPPELRQLRSHFRNDEQPVEDWSDTVSVTTLNQSAGDHPPRPRRTGSGPSLHEVANAECSDFQKDALAISLSFQTVMFHGWQGQW